MAPQYHERNVYEFQTRFKNSFFQSILGYRGNRPKRGDEQLKPWPQDVIRHTAISNHFAYTKAEATTAAWAGNSPETVHRYYKGLVTPDQATAYWALTPEQMLAYTAETNTQPVDTTRAVVT